jgi:hypothetical protein
MGIGKQSQVEDVEVGATDYRALSKNSTAGKVLALDDHMVRRRVAPAVSVPPVTMPAVDTARAEALMKEVAAQRSRYPDLKSSL